MGFFAVSPLSPSPFKSISGFRRLSNLTGLYVSRSQMPVIVNVLHQRLFIDRLGCHLQATRCMLRCPHLQRSRWYKAHDQLCSLEASSLASPLSTSIHLAPCPQPLMSSSYTTTDPAVSGVKISSTARMVLEVFPALAFNRPIRLGGGLTSYAHIFPLTMVGNQPTDCVVRVRLRLLLSKYDTPR